MGKICTGALGEESGSPVKAASSNNTGEHWMHKLKNRAEGAVKVGWGCIKYTILLCFDASILVSNVNIAFVNRLE